MNLQEAIDYMRKTGNSVFVKNPKYVSDFEYKLGTWDTRGYTCLKHNRFYQNGKRVWRDVEMSAVDILEEMLSCTYEPHIEYLSFIEVMKLLKSNHKLTFTRKYYRDSYRDEYDNERGEYDTYLIFSDDVDGGIMLYNATFGVYLHLMPDDILATDWYVTEVKK